MRGDGPTVPIRTLIPLTTITDPMSRLYEWELKAIFQGDLDALNKVTRSCSFCLEKTKL